MTAADAFSTSHDAARLGSSALRLQTGIRLRWIAVIGQLFAVWAVYGWLGFDLPLASCLAMIALSAVLNVLLSARYPARFRLGTRFATGLLAYDLVQLAALLYLTGGLKNPFAFLLIAPVTVSAATLPPASTLFLGGIACAVASGLLFYHRALPWWPEEVLDLPLVYAFGLWSAIMSGMIFIGLYARRLAREARDMSNALAATESVLAREQQLHALDGLAAAAAHQLGTPLSTIAVVATELERNLPAGTSEAEDAALLKSQAQRCREILTSLTSRSSDEEDPLHAHMPISHLVDEAVEPYRVFEKTFTVSCKADPDARGEARTEPVTDRAPGVLHGLSNIVENATDFAESGVTVTAEWNGRTVRIEVLDDGPGFSQTMLDSLGEPYLTSRPFNRKSRRTPEGHSGLGLGFFIASTLLQRSGAEVTIRNRTAPLHGAIVTITWLRERFEKLAKVDREATNGGAGGGEFTILP